MGEPRESMSLGEHLYVSVKELTQWRAVAAMLRDINNVNADSCLRVAQHRIAHLERVTQVIMASPLMGEAGGDG